MRRPLGMLLAVVLLACLEPHASHGAPPPPADFDAKALLAGLEKARDLLADNASEADGRLLREAQIQILPDLIRDHDVYTKLTLDGREVMIPMSLVTELFITANAKYLELGFGTPNLTTAYFNHFTEAYTYRGRKLLPIEEFAHLDPNGRKRFQSKPLRTQIAGWVEHALVFALAHELGHHACNALYEVGASNEEKRRKETLADEWAAETMLAAGYSQLHGAMLLAYLFEYRERFIPAGFTGSHPPMPGRVLHLLTKYRVRQKATYQTPRYASVALDVYEKMEAGWEQELKAMGEQRAARTIAQLDKDASAGDIEANRILATNYAAGIGVAKDTQKAATYLTRAATAGDFWSQATLGTVYANGTLGTPEIARARFWLALADRAGARAASVSLTVIGKTAEKNQPAAWCQGKCVYDAALADLTPCITRNRAACVTSCVNDYKIAKPVCENRMCNNMNDEQRYFGSCFAPPTTFTWDSCLATCTPGSTPPNRPPASDGTTASLQRVIDAARTSFTSIRGKAAPRDPEDSSTTYDTSVIVPTTTNCTISVDDDPTVYASYSCAQYRGTDLDRIEREYQALRTRADAALTSLGAGPCTETTREVGTRYRQQVKQCRALLPGGVAIRVRQNISKSDPPSSHSVTLWIDAPER